MENKIELVETKNFGRKKALSSDDDDAPAHPRRGHRQSIHEGLELSYEDCRKTLKAGRTFTKHAYGRDISGRREVWIAERDGKAFLCWGKPVESNRQEDPDRRVSFDSIRHVYLGKQTNAFKRNGARDVADEECFSIMTDSRTIDLQVESRKQRDGWLAMFKVMLDHYDVSYRIHPSPNVKDEKVERKGTPIKYQIAVRAKNLPRRTEDKELDSLVVAFEENPNTFRLNYIAQTDVRFADDQPHYGTPLIVPYYPGAQQLIKFAVYSAEGDKLTENQQVGFASVPLSMLVEGDELGIEHEFKLKGPDSRQEKRLKDSDATIYVTCTPALLTEGELLAKMQRIFMASDSFYFYHTQHPASRVLLFMRKATAEKPDMLYWCRDNTVDKFGRETKEKPKAVEFADCCMPLMSITDIYLGKQTPAFERPPANKAPSDRCFSIKSSFNSRHLDLQAKTPAVRDAWVFGLMALIRQLHAAQAVREGRKARVQDRITLHPEPQPPRKTPIPHTPNFKLTLDIRCKNLPESIDPLVGVFLKGHDTGKFRFCGHTEGQMDKTDPIFKDRVVVDYVGERGADDEVKLVVYKVEDSQIREKDTLGYATLSVTALLDSAGREMLVSLHNPRSKPLNRLLSERKAIISVRNLQAFPSGTMQFLIKGRNLATLDGSQLGAKSYVALAFETLDRKDDEKKAATPKAKPQNQPVRYHSQTELQKGANCDFKNIVGPFSYNGGDGKQVRIGIFVVKDEAGALALKDMVPSKQQLELLGIANVPLDTLMMNGCEAIAFDLTNPDDRTRDGRLKNSGSHIIVQTLFRPNNVAAAEVKEGKQPVDGSSSPRMAGQGIPPAIRTLLQKMTEGKNFIVYVPGGAVKAALFYKEDMQGAGTIYWCAADQREANPQQSLPLSTVTDVYLGKQFTAFQECPADNTVCLSIVSPTCQLHLRATSNKTRDVWALGVMGACKAFNHPAVLREVPVAAAPAAPLSPTGLTATPGFGRAKSFRSPVLGPADAKSSQ